MKRRHQVAVVFLATLLAAPHADAAKPKPRPKSAAPAAAATPTEPPPVPVVAPTPIDPNEARVAELRARGDSAIDNGNPADALVAYTEASTLSSDPALLYNMGRALQGLARYAEALDRMEAFAAKASPELRARVPRLDALIAQLRGRVATLTLRCNVPGAEVRIREHEVGKTPMTPSLKVDAGHATLEVVAEGYLPDKREIDLPGGGLSSIDVILRSKATNGVLLVTSPVTGTLVSIDDQPSGKVPLEAILTAGTHTLSLGKDGYEPTRTSTVLGAGERKSVSIPLEEVRPLTSKWWFWTIVGAAVAGGVVTVVALTTERKPDSGTIAPGQVGGALRF